MKIETMEHGKVTCCCVVNIADSALSDYVGQHIECYIGTV